MKLTYRGITYDYTPPEVATRSTGEAGKYRGVDVRFRTVNHPPIQPAKVNMMYRGVPYNTETAAEGSDAPVAIPTERVSISERMRALVVAHVRNIRRREQSMLARIDERVGLTAADAARYESSIQGKVRHSFGGYDRSRAAMS